MRSTACVGLCKRLRSGQFRNVSGLVRARSVSPCPLLFYPLIRSVEGVLVIGSVLVLLLVMGVNGKSLALGCVGLVRRYSCISLREPRLYLPILTIDF